MNIRLEPEHEEMVRALLEQGEYQNESELIGDAIRLLKSRTRLREALATALAESDRGELIEEDVMFAELRERVLNRSDDGESP
ncbi:MAG: hypothetical protein WD066_13520 [Planctomycetaceae bacterium]